VIVGNPVMIDAYREGIPGNGKPFPDGAKMAKIHWNPKKQETYPGQPTVPGAQHDVDFMVKDSKRFADSGGWGWAVLDYDAAFDTFTPGNLGWQAAARERRQVRVCLPFDREGKRLRFHRLRAQVSGMSSTQSGATRAADLWVQLPIKVELYEGARTDRPGLAALADEVTK